MMGTEPTSVARLSMSLPSELFRQLDMMVEERGLPSRSQLIAELIRHALAAHEATTRPDETNSLTIETAFSEVRSTSGLIWPPGSTIAS